MRGRPDLRTILLMLFLIGTFGMNFPIFTSAMAVKVFHADAKGFGLACALSAIAPGYWLFAAGLAVTGAAVLTFANATNGLMQLSSEPSMRGRVMALRIAIALGCTPIGAPIVGWVADAFGPRWALGVGAASGFAAAAVFPSRSFRQKAGPNVVQSSEGAKAYAEL